LDLKNSGFDYLFVINFISMNRAVLALGANQLNRFANINQAVQSLKLHSKLLNSSFIYETEPMYLKD